MAGHRFNPEKAAMLLDPKRKELVDPVVIISLLHIQEGDIIADFGAGNGFFTVPIANKTKETVYAIDVQEQMLHYLKKQAQQEGVTNIEYVLGDVKNIPLKSKSIDKGLIAFVIHEVSNLDPAVEEMFRVIKPNGKLLILDWEAIESEMGPPVHERISSKKLNDYFRQKGFQPELFRFHEAIYGMLITNGKNEVNSSIFHDPKEGTS
ncbi:class I SAM-dependent methyltransferase [Bacillus alveayuensis]|uniref:class I SAM-dependent methyltransferase n=1 Tax=Aeribacillus alveayuensis TaxID=279215 RepID=UPI0005D0F471|nr:methyltransferase domain-containing protein [Bacillus alveayuensis]